MRCLKIILVCLFISINGSHSTFATDLEGISSQHDARVRKLLAQKVTRSQEYIAKNLMKLSKGRLNQSLANYLAKKPLYVASFWKASKFANQQSILLCNVKNEKNVYDNEVDALRHSLWSMRLSFYLGSKAAFEITSLQEVKASNIKKSLEMDIFNNYQAIIKGAELRNTLHSNMSKKEVLRAIIRESYDLLYQGALIVLKNSSSECYFPEFYPNH